MVDIIRLETSLTPSTLNDFAHQSPVVFVFFDYPGVEETVHALFAGTEAGELVVIADYKLASEVAKKYGAVVPQSMLGFAINTFTSMATQPEQYATVVQETRDWRRRQKKAEQRQFNRGS